VFANQTIPQALRCLASRESIVIADAIAKVVADDVYAIQPGDEGIAIARWELSNALQSTFEHADKCIDVAVILIPDIVAVSDYILPTERVRSSPR